MILCCAVVLERFRAWPVFEVATGDDGEGGRYDESEAFSEGPDELAMLPLPPRAAGGRAKPPSSRGALTLLLPVMSVEAAGVGGKLGRGMILTEVALMGQGSLYPVAIHIRRL
jgi:hypothetical protein